MEYIDGSVELKLPTELPIPYHFRHFFGDRNLVLIPTSISVQKSIEWDIVIGGFEASAVFEYRNEIPDRYAGKPISWFGWTKRSPSSNLKTVDWWSIWCKSKRIPVRPFRPIQAVFTFNSETSIGMYGFHKAGVFKLRLTLPDMPGSVTAAISAINQLQLDLLASYLATGDRCQDFVVTCGSTRPISKAEIRAHLRRLLDLEDRFITIQGEDLTAEELSRQARRFSNVSSVFISYSHADIDFAIKLHNWLVKHDISCWLDNHQLLPGDKIHDSIQDGILTYDRLLLICSSSSLISWWVDNELEEVFAKERRTRVPLLVPIDIDRAVWSEPPVSSKCTQILSRYIGDFTGWRDEAAFNSAAAKLLTTLKPSVHHCDA